MVPSLRKAALIALMPVVALSLLGACSEGDNDDASPIAGSTAPLGDIQPQPQPVQALDTATTEPENELIEVTVRGAAYNGNNLEIPLGQATTIRVENQDGQPHNLRIAGVDGQYGTEDDAVTNPETISGGEQGEVIFAPQVPGAYTFRCDFYPGSMGGRITVE